MQDFFFFFAHGNDRKSNYPTLLSTIQVLFNQHIHMQKHEAYIHSAEHFHHDLKFELQFDWL